MLCFSFLVVQIPKLSDVGIAIFFMRHVQTCAASDVSTTQIFMLLCVQDQATANTTNLMKLNLQQSLRDKQTSDS